MLEILINGLARGSIYALVALGYTMVYGILGMINFAHGEIFMIGMYACVYGIALCGTFLGLNPFWNLAFGIVFAVVLASAFGFANERIAYRKLRKAHLLAPLTSAIGLSMVLQNFVMLSVSKNPLNFPSAYSEWWRNSKISVFGANVTYLQLAILGTALLLMVGLFWLIHRTRLGIALRATAQDPLMAGLVGIPVNKVIAFTFVLGSGLAAIAGVMVAMYQSTFQFAVGYSFGLKAFTAAILGGIGNIPGAVLGGLIIGLMEDTTSHFIGSEWKEVTVFSLLMLVLIFRPRGLLGERVADKV
jgi:branched-chain amino acid transport system permease protein